MPSLGPQSRPDRYAGCLIGQCVGDALGFIVEGMQPEECAEYVDQHVRPISLKGLMRGPFRVGQYSDDSQLARELMQSFVDRGGFDVVDYARRIAALFLENRIVGRGRATEQAAARLEGGIPWHEAGTPSPAAGNGSAMRAGPVGLFCMDFEELVQIAHDQGRMTHQDPRCSAGAVAIAGAVALSLKADKIVVADTCNALAELCQRFDPILAIGLQQLPSWLELPLSDVVDLVKEMGLSPDYGQDWPGISPFVTVSVLWSVYAFLRSPEDYLEAICTAISVGGDVDTTAAMTGAISGAYLGVAAIPNELTEIINDQGSWTYPDLVDLAHQVYEITTNA